MHLLTTMTASDPDQRPTAADCARALRTNPAENTLPIPAQVPLTAPDEAPRTARVPRKALLASATALLGAVSVAWAITPGTQPVNSAPPSTAPAATATSSAAAAVSTAPPQTAATVFQQPAAQADTAAPAQVERQQVEPAAEPEPGPKKQSGPKKQKDTPQSPGKSKK
jgi:hypothetical protein